MKSKKEEILKFIKEFNKITVASICNEKGIRADNVCRGTTTLENLVIVKKELKKKMMILLAEDSTIEDDIQ